MTRLSLSTLLAAFVAASFASMGSCFFVAPIARLPSFGRTAGTTTTAPSQLYSGVSEGQYIQEEEAAFSSVNDRIQSLVDTHPVLLFMKGTKLFPQCGFSNTATQILYSFNIEFHTIDVLSDESIRQGVKEFSSWPTIPQLYVGGEFIGGSDIMIELYQSGELGELIEKVLADKID
jgi:monothiol glutaredoxin